MQEKIVLVRDLSNLAEARYCAGMGVKYIGFEFNPDHESYISAAKRNEIIQWVSGVEILASFTGGSPSDLANCSQESKLNGYILEKGQEEFIRDLEGAVFFVEAEKEISSENKTIFNLGSSIKAYDFNNVNLGPDAAGYAFKGSLEQETGVNNYEDLMEALEKIFD
jgi:hypothetical protein